MQNFYSQPVQPTFRYFGRDITNVPSDNLQSLSQLPANKNLVSLSTISQSGSKDFQQSTYNSLTQPDQSCKQDMESHDKGLNSYFSFQQPSNQSESNPSRQNENKMVSEESQLSQPLSSQPLSTSNCTASNGTITSSQNTNSNNMALNHNSSNLGSNNNQYENIIEYSEAEQEMMQENAKKHLDENTRDFQYMVDKRNQCQQKFNNVSLAQMNPENQSTINLFNIDNCSPKPNTQSVQEKDQSCQYLNEILNYLHSIQANWIPANKKPSYLRASAIDWLIYVQIKLNLTCETLFIAVNIMDRFLDKYYKSESIQLSDIKLIAGTCLFLAAKYEEIYPPVITDFILKMKEFKKSEVLHTEGLIITTLGFTFTCPTPLRFLEAYLEFDPEKLSEQQKYLAHYIIQLALHDPKLIDCEPSKIAAAAILVVKKLSNINSSYLWNEALESMTKSKQQDLENIGNMLYILLMQIQVSPQSHVYIKFSQKKFGSIAQNFQFPKF